MLLEIAYNRFKGNNENDFVILNGPIIIQKSNKQSMLAKKSIAKNLLLYRKTCELLLSCSTYFSVNKLYKREF